MTQTVINVDKYLDSVVGKALRLNKQALALTMPYIIEDYFKSFTLTYLEDRTPVLCDKNRFWKLCCGRKTFDIAPSFTKGHARSKEGVDVVGHLVDKGFDGICFVEFSDVSSVLLKWVSISNLPETINGVYRKGEIFE